MSVGPAPVVVGAVAAEVVGVVEAGRDGLDVTRREVVELGGGGCCKGKDEVDGCEGSPVFLRLFAPVGTTTTGEGAGDCCVVMYVDDQDSSSEVGPGEVNVGESALAEAVEDETLEGGSSSSVSIVAGPGVISLIARFFFDFCAFSAPVDPDFFDLRRPSVEF